LDSRARMVIRVLLDKPVIPDLLEARVLLARSDCRGIKAFKEQLELRVLQGLQDNRDKLETLVSRVTQVRVVPLELLAPMVSNM